MKMRGVSTCSTQWHYNPRLVKSVVAAQGAFHKQVCDNVRESHYRQWLTGNRDTIPEFPVGLCLGHSLVEARCNVKRFQHSNRAIASGDNEGK